jgi:hypothetical protein
MVRPPVDRCERRAVGRRVRYRQPKDDPERPNALVKCSCSAVRLHSTCAATTSISVLTGDRTMIEQSTSATLRVRRVVRKTTS